VENSSQSPGTLTLIGSGEMSPSMGKVHRAVMSRILGAVQAVFLDTPAGFELNADPISANAVQYFKQHLNLDLAVASFKAAAAATPAKLENALRKLQQANYIFAGPGSPTYAIRNWQGTSIFQAMAMRLATGAHLVFASAAAIAMGRYALPVYELYKVGEDPHWAAGLDLLGPYNLELAIVPHWNNSEGGTHDTRYCFMGEPRMSFLEKRLPDSATILGIDEYTACILDLSRGEGAIMGAGQVTIRQRGRDDRTYPADSHFALDELRAALPPGESRTASAAITGERPAAWIDWPDALEDETESADAFIDLLVQVRTRLRTEKQWALADEIRRRLAELGITLEDDPTETTWRRG
jgi:hypothetical protein